MFTTQLVKAEILDNVEIAPGHFILKIESPEIASQAHSGQFAYISCGDRKDIVLRRPLSFYKIEKENIFFLYQVVGKGTSILKTRSCGEKISVLGPLGKGFWFENNGKKKIVLAGGVGIAPFPFLIKEMLSAKIALQDISLIYGVKRKELLIGIDEFRPTGISIYIATDNGDEGFKGTALDLLLNLLRKGEIKTGDYFACGPEIMMKKAVEIARKQGDRVQVSLEERMGCGVGACLGCVRRINRQYLRVCKDGPVFWGDEVEW